MFKFRDFSNFWVFFFNNFELAYNASLGIWGKAAVNVRAACSNKTVYKAVLYDHMKGVTQLYIS